MITSHRDRRAFQNYGYFSRSFLFCRMKSSNLGKRLFAQDKAQATRFAWLGKVVGHRYFGRHPHGSAVERSPNDPNFRR